MVVRLRKIDRTEFIRVVAPSSPVNDRRGFEAGVELLSKRYRVSVPKSVFARQGFLAGSDGTRLGLLDRACCSARTGAVFTARGGHGATRLLSSMGWKQWSENPVPLVGFSDVTALELAALALARVATIHGPSVTSLARQPRSYFEHLTRLLEDPAYEFGSPPVQLRSLRKGRCAGHLVGGNLTMIDQLVGTPYLPDLTGSILMIEEVNEAPYRIDRMLTHMRNAGILDGIGGIVMGDFIGCPPRPDGVTAEQVVLEHARRARIPALGGMPCGHGKRNWAFIQGSKVRMHCGHRGDKARIEAVK